MRGQKSSQFTSRKPFSSFHLQNSSISSTFQSRYINLAQESQGFKILSYKFDNEHQKQKVLQRCNLRIQYIPEFELIAENQQNLTIKIKQYPLELLPWLIKKDSLFKVNIVLGIYVAFLQLIDLYGMFPLHPNMMKVNQKQQVAIWINKNFQLLQPDQTLTRSAFSMRQFIKSFLRIFKCCLPNKRMSEMYNDTNELLVELTKIKRKQQMHKNCHQFIKHDSKLHNSRKSKRNQSQLFTESLQLVLSQQRYSTNIIDKSSKISLSLKKDKFRLSSFSPPRRTVKNAFSQQKFNQTTGFKKKLSTTFQVNPLQKKFSQRIPTESNIENRTSQGKQLSISTTGELFKRYLLYNTSKYQKMSKSGTLNSQIDFKAFPDKSKLIFRSQVYRLDENSYSQKLIEERNSVQLLSEQYIAPSQEEKFSPIKFRKMSSNTSQRIQKDELNKQFMKSGGTPRKTFFKQQQNYLFACKQNDQNYFKREESKQKLKSSFPYKTASTLTSFRLSNQNQYHHIFPSKSQQNLNACSLQNIVPLSQKEKDKQIEQMKIQQQNQLQSEFNNIFSMQNSKVRKQEEDKRLEKIISEFQQILF